MLKHAKKQWCSWRGFITSTVLTLWCGFTSAGPIGASFDQLFEINADFGRSHELAPAGVPSSYSWARWPRIGAGNRPPAGFGAVTGWGHVFYASSPIGSDPGIVEIRNMNVYVCDKTGGNWRRLQTGSIEGGEYRADFSKNTSKQPGLFSVLDGVAKVKFEFGNTFHFWPRQGRALLPKGDLCGFAILLEARVVPNSQGSGARGIYLMGLGADYWTSVSAPWDNFKTNTDVAIGRLKIINEKWDLFGLSTATDVDLKKLVVGGYLD